MVEEARRLLSDQRVSGALIVGCGIVAVWGGYTWYPSRIYNRQQNAQRAFYEAMQEYKKARVTSGLWTDVEKVFELAEHQNDASTLTPYFYAYQAQALLEKGEIAQALDLLQKAINIVGDAAPMLAPLYRIMHALVTIDAGDVQTGLAQLHKSAADTHNPYRDMALFYSGEYALSVGNKDEALGQWKDLVALFGDRTDQSGTSSAWVALAQQRLKGLAQL